MVKKEWVRIMVKIKWKCRQCKQIIISDTKERHTMDTCSCEASSCDAEEEYCRWAGDAEFIKLLK